jgi:hypothetical protein
MENNISKCKGCGENIRWIKTKAGKNMPCEICGVQGMTEDGEMTVVFIPHWSNCLKAQDFKRHVENRR